MARSLLLTVEQLVRQSGVSASFLGDVSRVVSGITQDSRKVIRGDVYCCIRGEHFDGNAFIDDAIAAGAVAIVSDRAPEKIREEVCFVVVDDVRSVIGVLAREIFGRPNESLTIVGVTGTNGKTSTASILGSICSAQGFPTYVMGTLSGEKTTPEAIDLYATLRDLTDSGISHVIMEVSSHALAQGRVTGIEFAVGVFTNLGRDHLDFHGSDENYFSAKAKLFEPSVSKKGVVNRDDTHGRLLFDARHIDMETFSMEDAQAVTIGVDRVSFDWRSSRIEVPMGGHFTVINTLAAITAAECLGMPRTAVVKGCKELTPVPGRFQSVPNSLGIGVVIDYAHTPDALRSLLTTVKEVAQGKTIVVFGCGGDRDSGKRPEMGAVAREFSDHVFVTSDNPRSEDPQLIIDQILGGMPNLTGVDSVVDRAEAIKSAISGAGRGDIVVIAGKGHEATQDIKGVKTPFSDIDHAHQALADRKGDDT